MLDLINQLSSQYIEGIRLKALMLKMYRTGAEVVSVLKRLPERD